MIKLVAFLGNRGSQYEQTRHNVGWQIAENIAALEYVQWQNKFKGLYVQEHAGSEKVIFLKPLTFMNNSGESVQATMHFFKFTPRELLVVYDDIELDFGFVGFKKSGGLAGHNGLRSVANILKTKDFYRFRFGVSRPTHGNVSSFVLSKFSTDEQIVLPVVLKKAGEMLEYCFLEGIESAVQNCPKVKLV
jgi:peptidyl-tRNA hydrolase, PTH1 family